MDRRCGTLVCKSGRNLSVREQEKKSQAIQINDITKISSQVPVNMQTFRQYDIAANIPFSIEKWMNASITTSLYYNSYSSPLQGGQLQNDYTAWDLNLTSSFLLGKKGWTGKLNGFYQSKNVWGQFTIRNLAQVSMEMQKVSKNKKSVYKLAVADIFSTNHIAVIVKYQNQDWFTNRTRD